MSCYFSVILQELGNTEGRLGLRKDILKEALIELIFEI